MQNKDFTLEDLQHTQYYMLCKLNDICEKIGASIEYLPYTQGISTTQIKEKMKNNG